MFGHKSFISGNVRETGARSLCSSNVAYIIKDIFLEIIRKYPLDYV